MRVLASVLVLTCTALLCCAQSFASPTCPEEQEAKQRPPEDPSQCDALELVVRSPRSLPLNDYETALNEYVGLNCHRRLEKGWKVDKRVRDTGPSIGTYQAGTWTGKYFGTHQPVLVWYSPEMYAWLKANRPADGTLPTTPEPVPDGAMIIKEMYPAPAAACAGIDWERLKPTKNGIAAMIRDRLGAYDGWFWASIGWTGWKADWPTAPGNPLPFSGFGQYCLNCHASAADNHTFSALKNIKGEPGEPLVFLSQNFFLDPSWQSRHLGIVQSAAKSAAPAEEPPYDPAFTKLYWSLNGPPPRNRVGAMPSETYDNVWVKAGEPTAASQFVTSDQCVGCHSAGGTGLQFDMTAPGGDSKLVNLSPYGTWRGSPMGLAGRDPMFFAQLASETQTFHPKLASMVEDTCLGCHGIMGQRQSAIDSYTKSGACGNFSRDTMNAVPYPTGKPAAALAHYGALAREGISCTSCHRMVVGKTDEAKYSSQPQNMCVEARQQALNPGLNGFARTFTGSFLVGPPDQLYGPFREPKLKPMTRAIGSSPQHNANVLSSELCGSCHTVHLPILHRDRTIGHTYEQTTYPEWAFSAYRTGSTPDGPLPSGAGTQPQSCQGCHMPNKDADGNPYRSKIATIQEYTNFPQAENTLPPSDIDLPTRTGFARHTLVGLNVFLLKMASQFADILGIRRTDPMLTDKGIDSIPTAVNAMLDQAATQTAAVAVTSVTKEIEAGTLNARVTVSNRVGHKFPSGVGFRRAFVQFSVLDKDNKTLWSSGRTNSMGVIVGNNGVPLAGELWWKADCSARIDPGARLHQPHYQAITQQDQAQIYEELVAAPADVAAPTCGVGARPAGPLTTSFLSICAKVKDNRLLPQGFLPLRDRIRISRALGADPKMAEESGPTAVDDDPDYVNGGSDTLLYRVPLSELSGEPAAVEATLYYQATPPYYLQDRFCTSNGIDTNRLYYLAGKLDVSGPTKDWKLRVGTSGPVPVP